MEWFFAKNIGRRVLHQDPPNKTIANSGWFSLVVKLFSGTLSIGNSAGKNHIIENISYLSMMWVYSQRFPFRRPNGEFATNIVVRRPRRIGIEFKHALPFQTWDQILFPSVFLWEASWLHEPWWRLAQTPGSWIDVFRRYNDRKTLFQLVLARLLDQIYTFRCCKVVKLLYIRRRLRPWEKKTCVTRIPLNRSCYDVWTLSNYYIYGIPSTSRRWDLCTSFDQIGNYHVHRVFMKQHFCIAF